MTAVNHIRNATNLLTGDDAERKTELKKRDVRRVIRDLHFGGEAL